MQTHPYRRPGLIFLNVFQAIINKVAPILNIPPVKAMILIHGGEYRTHLELI